MRNASIKQMDSPVSFVRSSCCYCCCCCCGSCLCFGINPNPTGQISIIPKPELRGFWGSSFIKPPFRVTSADVVIICPDPIVKGSGYEMDMKGQVHPQI